MTNGEKIKELFPNAKYLECEVVMDVVFTRNQENWFDLEWWNAEYKEPTTKNNLVVDNQNIRLIDANALIKRLLPKHFDWWGEDEQEQDDFSKGNNSMLDEVIEAIQEFPSATSQEPVLDKIRVEIEHLTIAEGGYDYVRKMAELFSFKVKVLQIIDKYKAESEET